MQQKQRSPHSPLRTRAISLLLAAVLILGLVPGFTGEASAHWADGYLNQLVEWGFIRPDQANSPDGELTRADFMAITNRAYGYDDVGETPFTDVAVTDWFYDDVGIAYNARYINGTSPTTASPNDPLNRETAATILGRNMMLQESAGEILDFTDARDISSWARGTVKSSLEHYLVGGYDDGTFKPQKDLSWGEMAAMLSRIVGTPLQEAGDYSLGGVFGNVTISADGVTLRDTVISGDLYVTGGVGLGGVKLENVTVLGRIIASGTGESEGGQASILLRNVTADELLVDNLQDHYVTLKADGITEIGNTTVRTSAYIEDNTPDGMGLKYISLEGTPDPETGEYPPIQLDLAGRIEEVVNRTPNSQVRAAKGTVKKLTIDEAATDSTVVIDRNTVVKELNLDVGTNVIGEGDIEKLVVNAPGCTVEMLPDQIEIRPGITAVIDGVEMDSTAAEESSMEPLILAGYPQAQDIAPNSITAVFSTNKRGTVYWAVSPITDGSVEADDLIKPPAYGSIAVSNGSVLSPKGNEEVSSAVAGLTAGGNYYLSAVLVDDRGHRSPTKVISFTTPDNSVPAFAKGYPYMSLITNTDAQVTVMTTKSCKLYYALLPEGAPAPTEDELRSGAVPGNLGYGVRDETKNTEDVFNVNDVALEELKTYTVYFWLVDADGVNKSPITSLTFTTVDKTPPDLTVKPWQSDTKDKSVGVTFQMSEPGTFYWALVPAGADYPRPQPGQPSILPTDEYAILQVASGRFALKSGSVRVPKANTDVTFNISGLTEETSYDLWYVAQDSEGNYSIRVEKIVVSTLDTKGPGITQHFTRHAGDDDTKRPTRDTDIELRFNEDVAYADGGDSFWGLWQTYESASGQDKERTWERVVESLRGSITLKKVGTREDPAVSFLGEDGVTESDDEWVDYGTHDRPKVQMEMNDGKLTVRFLNAGLKLKSGITYYYEITNMVDASAGNKISPPVANYKTTVNNERFNIPSFEIEFASITIDREPGGGDARPYSRRDEDGKLLTGTDADGNYLISDEMVICDMQFAMWPDSTSTVDPEIRFDMPAWAKSTCTFDLYYRFLDKSEKPITNPTSNSATAGHLLPTKDGYGVADKNGWFYLGESGNLQTTGNPMVGQMIFGEIVGLDSTKLPSLSTLSEDMGYQFAINLRKNGTSTDRKTWNTPVTLDFFAAAGWSTNFSTLTNRMTWDNWVKYSDDKKGLATGVKSIGSWIDEDGKNQQYVEVFQEYTDSRLPAFSVTFRPPTDKDGNGKLDPTTSEVMNLSLTRAGLIYYVIAKADVGGESATDYNKWDPSITTLLSKEGNDHIPNLGSHDIKKTESVQGQEGQEGYVIWPSDVPNGSPGKTPNLIWPSDLSIQNPQDFFALTDLAAYKQSMAHPGGSVIPEIVEKLEPNTTYYAYFVITNTRGNEISEVLLYKFKTAAIKKPVITIADDGKVGQIETDIASELWYLVYTKDSMEEMIPFLDEKQFSDYTDTTLTVPDYYTSSFAESTGGHKRGMTVLEALSTPYDYYSASNNSTNSSTAYLPQITETYSVFDIYASTEVKNRMYTWLVNKAPPAGIPTVPSQSGKPLLPVGSQGLKALQTNGSGDWKEIQGLTLGDDFVVLAMAQNKNAPNVAMGLKTSFSAASIPRRSTTGPVLLDINFVTLEKDGGTTAQDATFKGSIELIFDKALCDNTGTRYTDGDKFLEDAGIKAHFTSASLSTTSNSGGKVTLTFEKWATRDMTILPGAFFNEWKRGNPERIAISFKKDTQGTTNDAGLPLMQVVLSATATNINDNSVKTFGPKTRPLLADGTPQ